MKKTKLDRNHFILMFFAFTFGMILSNLIGQKHTLKPNDSAPALFAYKGIDKTENELSPDMKAAYNSLKEKEYRLLENAGLEQHLYQYAHDHSVSFEQAGKEIFDFKEPTEEQISQFYTVNKTVLNKPYFLVKETIKKQLSNLQVKQSKRKVLAMLKKKGDLVVLMRREGYEKPVLKNTK